MSQKTIDHLVINSPYDEPSEYWAYLSEKQEFERKQGRRSAGYWRTTGVARRDAEDPGEWVLIELVEKIRPRVAKWRAADYPGVTATTKKLLRHWHDKEQRSYPLFWCQLEAVETAIWLAEGSDAEKQGLGIRDLSDSDWERQCLKLATGSGKTIVMAMLIAWQTLNKLAYKQDTRFAKNILILAPGITVKDRLQVLRPERDDNFYDEFNIVPASMRHELAQARIVIENWHTLMPKKESQGPKVVKKGPESDEAFVRRTLPDFGTSKNILVINDEAHHCHRPTPDADESKEEQEKATIWVEGIDRIHRARGVLRAYDLTATPFKPTGHAVGGEQLFPWIVYDFGLNDAIESGLVKTPRVAVRDDQAIDSNFRSKLFHIYPHVKEGLRRAEENEGLPDLVRNALNILGADWLKTREQWKEDEHPTPPVMIVIANVKETADRIAYSVKTGQTAITELEGKNSLLLIHQAALDRLEAGEGASGNKSQQELAEKERERLNTVGKEGKPGADVQLVVGVNMLSEGWDARTVTHILGLRAFTSQLLCEQVVGRGLRRRSYDIGEDGLFAPEYVTVFGVPFTYLPVEGSTKVEKGQIETKRTKIEPRSDRGNLEIKWPHVLRVQPKLSYYLDLDWDKVAELRLSPSDAPTVVDVAPIVDGHPDFSKLSEIDLSKLAEENRLQKTMLRIAAQLHQQLADNWPGDPGSHVGQLMSVIQRFIDSDKLKISLPKFEGADQLRRIMIALNIQKISDHIRNAITQSNAESPVAVFDPIRPIRSTATAPAWYTSKPSQPVQKSQISHIVIDSKWEAIGLEFERDRIPGIVAWAKNEHLGFEINYLWKGEPKIYYPDFLIKFKDGRTMILEVKGQKRDKDKAKWEAADAWVRAVNDNGAFGQWEFKVLEDPKDLFDVVK